MLARPHGLARVFRVDRMVKGNAEAAFGDPGHMSADPADAAQMYFDQLTPDNAQWRFCHQATGRQIANSNFALMLGARKPQDRFQQQAVAVQLAFDGLCVGLHRIVHIALPMGMIASVLRNITGRKMWLKG